MKIDVKKKENEIVISAQGRIDTYTAEDFEKSLLEAIEQEDCVRLDFEEVEFISSAGLRALLSGQKKVDEDEKEMIVCNINEVVESVFVSTGFMNVLTVE